MKKLLTILFFIITSISYSQDYPRIETDSTGKKLVVLTYEQAQKIDNAFELLTLLEKAGAECYSLTLSYIKVIDVLKHQTSLLEIDVKLYKNQVIDKDKQIENLQQRLNNCETVKSTCDQQISLRDKQIVLLDNEIKTLKTKRNIAYGSGIAGIVGGILLVLFVH
jgi:vacuolar-type H+-ATPase subunit I/STV1